jgi:post-segregation antitoxin (ccd killing protein)
LNTPHSVSANPTSGAHVPLPGSIAGNSAEQAASRVSEEFSDTYTRLLIIGTDFADRAGSAGEPNENFLPYDSRGTIKRYLSGKNYTTNLTAKVVVGTFEATVPLATVTHRSDSNGEHWARSIHYNALNFPLFLVRSDGAASIPSITFTLNASNEMTSMGAAAGLQAALTIARATGTAASVVTQLSEQATKERARAIDNVVSKLFSSGIQEEHVSDRDLRLWQSDNGKPVGVAVEFAVPSEEGNWKSTPNKVGKWTFSFDFPRRSIFSDWRICGEVRLPKCTLNREESQKKILQDIDASSVLNYGLLNTYLGSIRSYLGQQDWYMSAINGMSNSDAKTRESAANNLCRRVRNEITSLGLNGFDADIVLWAVWTGMPLPDNKPDPTKMADCKHSFDLVKK